MKKKKRVARGKKRRAGKGMSLQAAAGGKSGARRRFGLSPELYGLYRPLKRPVTLRLDADVIEWFKKDGKRYQTRINIALRKVMEREMKAR